MNHERMRMQLRVVQTVFRAEMKRLDGNPSTAEREARVRELGSRSMTLLERLSAELDGSAGWHVEMSASVREVAAQLRAPRNAGKPPVISAE